MTDKATSEYFITGNRLGIVFECGPQSQTALLRAFPWLRSIRDGFESNRPLAPVGTQASMPDAANRADDVYASGEGHGGGLFGWAADRAQAASAATFCQCQFQGRSS
jgi:hypothetical protein